MNVILSKFRGSLAQCWTLFPLFVISLVLTQVSCNASLNHLKRESLRSARAGNVEGPSNYRAYSAYLRAVDARRLGELEDAQSWIQRAIDLDTKNPTLVAWYGAVLAENHKEATAIEVTRQALELEPHHFRANLQLAELLRRADRLPEAEQVYMGLMQRTPPQEEAVLGLANLYRALDEAAKGLEVLEDYIQRGGEPSFMLQLLKAALHKDLSQWEQAETEYLAVLEQFPDFPQAQRALLELYLRTGNLKDSTSRLETLFAEKPWQVWIPEYLIQIYARLGNVEALNRHLLEAGESDRDFADQLRLDAVEELATRREFELARAVLEPMLTQSVENDRALLYAGFLYGRSQEYKKALEMYGKIAIGSDLYARAIEQRARVLNTMGKPDEAIQLLHEFLKTEPEAEELKYTLISILVSANRPQEGLVIADALLAQNPANLEARIQKAYVLQSMKKGQEAIVLLQDALTRDRTSIQIYDALASLFADEARYPEAVDSLKEAVKIEPDNIGIRFRLGMYYDTLKQHDNAISQMEKILEIDENNADALNFIGYTWAEMKVKLPEAELLIKRALELEPNNGYITDSLGWVYFQSGRYTEALPLLERAVELTTAEPVIVEHLGDAYEKVENLKSALDMYKRAATEFKAQEKPQPGDIERSESKYQGLKKKLEH